MTFGQNWGWGCDAPESRRILDAFINAGGNFIDTANIYTSGQAEQLLGEIVTPDRRERIVLATKYGDALPGDDPNAAGNHRKCMVQSVEKSLRRLKTDRVDILYIHSWDFTTRPDEVMRALDDLVRQGKILYAGISDAPAWVIARCNELADQRGLSPFVVCQLEYSLIERTAEREILPMARALDVGLVAWSPLAGGILTGKYTRPGEDGGKRRLDTVPYKKLSERNREIARDLVVLADELGFPPAAVALAWVAARGVIPIVGATHLQQLTDNFRYLDIVIPEFQLRQLDKVSHIDLGFPHEFHDAARGFIYGGMFDRLHRHRDEGIGITVARSGPGNVTPAGDFAYTDVLAKGMTSTE